LGCALYIRCAVSIHHKGCGKVWGARYTLGARYLPKNTVYLREIGWSGMNWICLVLDRDQWRALVNTVINFQVS
jgi:hypothetical protein